MKVASIILFVIICGLVVYLVIDTTIHFVKKFKQRKHDKEDVAVDDDNAKRE